MPKLKSLPTRVWRWVLWDRRNATRVVIGLVGAVAAFTVWSMVAPYLTYDEQAAAAAAAAADPTPTVTGSATVAPTWMPTLPAPTPSETTSAAELVEDLYPAGAGQYATAFVNTWLKARTTPEKQWRADTTSYTVGDASQLIELTDPLMVPKAAVVDAEVDVQTPFDATAAVDLTNGETILVSLTRVDGGWKVNLYGPELVDE